MMNTQKKKQDAEIINEEHLTLTKNNQSEYSRKYKKNK